MKTGIRIVCLSLLIAGCQHNNKIPGDILPRPKMQAVLWDIMRADRFLSDFVFIGDSTLDKQSESIKIYEQVFTIHHITKEEFQQSFSWYQAHPAVLKIIMDSLNQRSPSAPTQVVQPNDTVSRPFQRPVNGDTTSPRKRIPAVEE